MIQRLITITLISVISQYVQAQNVFPTNSTVVLDGHSLKVNYPNTTGGWARGFRFYDSSGTNPVGGMGLKGESTTVQKLYMAHGVSPWSSALGLYVNANGNTGIGVTNPVRKLHVSGGTSGDSIFRLEADIDNNNEADNTRIELLQDGGSLGVYLGFDKDWPSEWLSDNLFRIATRYSNNVISDAFVIRTDNGKVGIGTTSLEEKLTVAGSGKFQEVIVEENTGADFVFEEGYELPDLSELETFIKSNKRLPEIPTAEQMKEEGVKVGKLQIKLLQKIEELTLYAISQEKTLKQQTTENKKLKYQINKQQKLIDELFKRMNKLESGER